MNPLSIEDFPAFFRAIHDQRDPFPWQQRLLRQVAETGRWPSVLALPTGTGKTAALDVAVFAQALDATVPPADRRCPRRTVLVVDRRTVVDQAHRHACDISSALRQPSDPVVAKVAERLQLLTEGIDSDGDPLRVHVLRGGIPRDDSWTSNPTQPLVAVSTVDQVGSRLLFRGYGISSGMRPVHAGLLGNDVLFLLDEVHLACAFRDTLTMLKQRYRAFARRGLPDRWQVVQMSATPSSDDRFGEERLWFQLEPEDHKNPSLQRRLHARKPTRLVRVTRPGKDALAREIAAEAGAQARDGRAIGVVVNRVETARLVHDLLTQALAKQGIEPMLVTGRMRPYDRNVLEERLAREVGASRQRSNANSSADGHSGVRVVVATQCVEAGADLDFDVLLTECASLDALRQRFGRLNRLGISPWPRVASPDEPDGEKKEPRPDGAPAAPSNETFDRFNGFVFVREGDLKLKDGDAGDPVYGHALRKTWAYLEAIETLDFGIEALPLPSPERLEELVAPAPPAPLLLPAHLDAWVQTTPEPHADPEPALWLHGPRPTDLDVSVVWRADIDEHSLRDASESMHVLDILKARLEACPPRSIEALQVPLAAVRRWLLQQKPGELSDAGAIQLEADDDPGRSNGRPALIWRGDETDVWRGDRDKVRLKPGDTVVVPSTYGGLRHGNWDPNATAPVVDIGDFAQFVQKGQPTLRLHPRVLRLAGAGPELTPPRQPVSDDPEVDEHEEVRVFLEALSSVEGWLGRSAAALLEEFSLAGHAKSKAPRLIPIEALERDDQTEPGAERPVARDLRPLWVVLGHRRGGEDSLDLSAEAEQSSLTGRETYLDDHLRGVGEYARAFGEALGLPASLCTALERAGEWHDAGKADPRFQQWMHGGSAFKALRAERLLAKSAMSAHHRAAREGARRRSRYPKGGRHELLSLALLQSLPEPLVVPEDWDLVLYLVASHHGYCRPFAPCVHDEEPVRVEVALNGRSAQASTDHYLERLDSGVSDRFWRLVRRYGWHGLAWLEAILRLADHRRSEAESRGEVLSSTASEDRHAV